MNQRTSTNKGDDQIISEDQSIRFDPIQVKYLTPEIHVKFRRNGVEIRRKAKVRLGTGTHRLVFEEIARCDQNFRFVVLDGAAGVISTKVIVPKREQTPLDHNDEKISRSPQIRQLSTSVDKAQNSVEQAMNLLEEWLSQARTQSELEIAEWREGVELLEHTLMERVAHHNSLLDTMKKIKLKSSSPGPFKGQKSGPVFVEIHVDHEDRYQVELSYLLDLAAWRPIYQARLSEDQFELTGTKPKIEAKVNLEMSARFAQATQETWVACSAEFCLYPAPKDGFPVLNYPSYEQINVESCHVLTEMLALQPCLESPWASLCHLFSDQATLSLNLELNLSLPRPDVMVIGSGKLDTLLPISGGLIHRFVGDEWIGHNELDPLVLGDILILNFGLYAPIESCVKVSPFDEEKATDLHFNTDDTDSDDTDSDKQDTFEQIELALKNTDQQVRTVLVSHPLSHGQLVSLNEGRPANSAPVGWVLSADRCRLMRWVSIAPNRTERLSLLRKCL